MKTFYIAAAIAGYAGANSLVLLESVQEGNILLWTKPLETAAGMFANRISTIFAIDLFLVVAVAFVWMYDKGQRLGVKTRMAVLAADHAVRVGGSLQSYQQNPIPENEKSGVSKPLNTPAFHASRTHGKSSAAFSDLSTGSNTSRSPTLSGRGTGIGFRSVWVTCGRDALTGTPAEATANSTTGTHAGSMVSTMRTATVWLRLKTFITGAPRLVI